jgi:hypothetical protein
VALNDGNGIVVVGQNVGEQEDREKAAGGLI